MSEQQDILAEQHSGVAELTLNRVEARNALTYAMTARLLESLEFAAADPEVSVIVIRGNGKSFCAGGDLKEFSEGLGASAADYHESGAVWSRLMRMIPTLPVPVVVAAHGHAIAGGCALVCAADVALVEEGTKFGMAEIRLGMFPAIVYGTLAAAVGHRRARELALTGRMIDSDEAVQIGLAHRVLPADGSLQPTARQIGEELANVGRTPLGLAKDLMNTARRIDTDAATELGRSMRGAFMTGEAFEAGLARFLDRSKA